MKRRTFLQLSTIGGAALPGLTLAACQPAETGKGTAGTSAVLEFELDEMTVDQLQQAMAEGHLTARAITEKYQQRIEDVDRNGPVLRAVLETNPDALQIAEGLDRERQAGQVRGPLHGIPVLIKDNIDTADKMMTTAGALALQGHHAVQDSWVAARLRAAGAVILGKTNLSEWANFRSTRSTSGWSGRGGQTHNPYVLDRNPCGSSSGSGVAVSANLCALAIGTETNGSIVCPSSINGIVGIKPTVGLVGRSGIIPISESQDTAGPMTRTVRDGALLLGALTGADPRDPATQAGQGQSYTDYTPFLDPNGLAGARIGVARHLFGFNPDVDQLMENAIQVMKEKGATLIDLKDPVTEQVGGDAFQVLLYEFKDGVNKYLAGLGPDIPVKTLEDVIRYNKENAEKSMPFFGQELLIQAQEKGGLDSPEYRQALENVRQGCRDNGIDQVMDGNELDALIAPTGSPAWPTDLLNGDHFTGGSSSPAARAGYPNITVPAGFVYGLPVGISFFGRTYSEPVLLKFAYAYEQATRHRRPPEFLPTLKLG
jgi:amidase